MESYDASLGGVQTCQSNRIKRYVVLAQVINIRVFVWVLNIRVFVWVFNIRMVSAVAIKHPAKHPISNYRPKVGIFDLGTTLSIFGLALGIFNPNSPF